MKTRLTLPAFLLCAVLFLTVSTTSISSGQPQNNRGASGIRHANPPRVDRADEYVYSRGEVRSRTPERRIRSGQPQRREAVVRQHVRPRTLNIPRGHLPPAGSYRLWYPGRPPGLQPAPTYYYDAIRFAPAGAWVIYRPVYDSRYVYVQVIHPRHRGVVIEVRIYDASRGVYVRTERPSRVRYR